MSEQLTKPHPRLIDQLSRLHPFCALPRAELAAMPISKMQYKRRSLLKVRKDELYFLVYGQAAELRPSYLGRMAMLTRFKAGSVIGWYPIDGVIQQERETLYLVIPSAWRNFTLLLQHQQRVLHERVLELGQQLSLQLTTSVTERIQVMAREPGESKTELAMRVGCSREMVSRLLPDRTGEQA